MASFQAVCPIRPDPSSDFSSSLHRQLQIAGWQRSAVEQDCFAVRGELLETEAREQRRQPAADEVVDAVIGGPRQEPLPEVAHDGAVRRQHGVEIGLFDQDAAARPDCLREPAEHVDPLRNVMQEGPAAHQIVAPAERVAGDVDLADLEVRERQSVEEARVDVAGDDVSLGSDLPGQPVRDAAVAGADLEAPPALGDAELLQPEEHLRVEHPRHQGQALVLLRDRVGQHIVGHRILPRPDTPARIRRSCGSTFGAG